MTSKIEEEIISGKKLSELSSDQFHPGCPPVNKHIAESGEPDSVLYVDVGNTDPCQAHKPQCFKSLFIPIGCSISVQLENGFNMQIRFRCEQAARVFQPS